MQGVVGEEIYHDPARNSDSILKPIILPTIASRSFRKLLYPFEFRQSQHRVPEIVNYITVLIGTYFLAYIRVSLSSFM